MTDFWDQLYEFEEECKKVGIELLHKYPFESEEIHLFTRLINTRKWININHTSTYDMESVKNTDKIMKTFSENTKLDYKMVIKDNVYVDVIHATFYIKRPEPEIRKLLYNEE